MNKKITKRSRRVVKNKKYKSVKKGGSGGVGEYPCGLCGTRHRDPFEAIDCYTKCEAKEKAASGAGGPATGPALVSAATSVERPLTVDGILTRSRAPYAKRNNSVIIYTNSQENIGNLYAANVMGAQFDMPPIPWIIQKGAACPIVSVIQGVIASASIHKRHEIVALINSQSGKKIQVPLNIADAINTEYTQNPYEYKDLGKKRDNGQNYVLAKRAGLVGSAPDHPTPPMTSAWLSQMFGLEYDEIFRQLADWELHPDVQHSVQSRNFENCNVIIMNQLPFNDDGTLDMHSEIGRGANVPIHHIVSLIPLPGNNVLLYLDTINKDISGNLLTVSDFFNFIGSHPSYEGTIRCIPLSLFQSSADRMLAAEVAGFTVVGGGKNHRRSKQIKK